MTAIRRAAVLTAVALTAWAAGAAEKPTYAEKLGWPAGSKVLIFHIDDAGMCHDANVGTIEGLEQGVATSTSVMMPCPAVPEFVEYLKQHPDVDAGVHLTLTSEWATYRWGPVTDQAAVPGLLDEEGRMWRGVLEVFRHATPDEVEMEIRAQVNRAIEMGFTPTHLDSHMGTVFYPPFFERYTKVGVELGIPVLVFGGHLQHMGKWISILRWHVQKNAERVWDAGLPAIDDLILAPTRGATTYEEVQAQIIEWLLTMKPGVTQIIVHCTRPSEEFKHISDTGPKRLTELRIVTDPEVKQVIDEEGIILTTWRELKVRRDKVAAEQARQETAE